MCIYKCLHMSLDGRNEKYIFLWRRNGFWLCKSSHSPSTQKKKYYFQSNLNCTAYVFKRTFNYIYILFFLFYRKQYIMNILVCIHLTKYITYINMNGEKIEDTIIYYNTKGIFNKVQIKRDVFFFFLSKLVALHDFFVRKGGTISFHKFHEKIDFFSW